ncbi:MAG TPA: hypothetical protein VJC15_03910 [Candidatus Paceibacterota bacterium]
MPSTRQLKTKIGISNETKKLLEIEKLLGVDPAGLAPASPLAKGRALLYELRALGSTKSIIETKELLLQGILLLASGGSVVYGLCLWSNYTLKDPALSIA